MTIAAHLSTAGQVMGDAGDGVCGVLRRAVGLTGRVALRDDPAAGFEWTPLAALTGETFMVHLDRACVRHGGCEGSVARAAAANLYVGDVASTLAVPLTSALVEQRRAVLADPTQLVLGVDAVGEPTAIDLTGACLAVLPEDELAGRPGVVVAEDLTDLRRLAAESFAALMEPVVAAAARAVRRGRRSLWSETAERLGAAVLLVHRTLGSHPEAPAEAQALLDVAPRVLARTLDWVDVPVVAETLPWKRRAVCCLAYQTPEQARSFCAACPKLTRDETVAEMANWLEQHLTPR